MVPQVNFEYVADNHILYKEGRRVIKDEVLDHVSYKIFTDAKRSGQHDEFNIIPPSYFTLLSKGKGPNEYAWSEQEWENDIAPVLTEKIRSSLFPFQKKAISQMIQSRRCMNAASPGLGKSIQGLCALSYFRTPAKKGDVIICPSYLRSNWLNEIKTWLPHEVGNTTVIEKAGVKDIDNALSTLLYGKGIKIISYDMVANLLKQTTTPDFRIFNTVLMDESHFIKDSRTVRYRNIHRYIKRSNQLFLLTGTPSPNRPKELFSQFSLLQPTVFHDYMTFATRYCDGHLDKWRHFNDKGSSNVDELSYLMKKLVIRMRREDHLSDLPAILRERVVVTPKVPSKKFIQRQKKFIEELGKLETDANAQFKVQALASELFRETCTIKIPPVLAFLEDYCATNDLEKTILFCKHQAMMGAVTDFLTTKGHEFIGISGRTPMKDRSLMIDQFLNKEGCTFAVLTLGSCSTGLNLVPIRKTVFLEMDWSPATLDQAEARSNRIGGAKNLHYVYITCENSLDDMVFNKLTRKTALVNTVVDSGVDYGDFYFDTKRRRIT